MDPSQPNTPITPAEHIMPDPIVPPAPVALPQPSLITEAQSVAQTTQAPAVNTVLTQPITPADTIGAPTGSQPISPQPLSPSQPGPLPQQGNTAPIKKPVNKAFIIIPIALVTLQILGFFAYTYINKKTEPLATDLGNSIANKIINKSDVVNRSDGTLDLGTLIDRQASIKTQDLKGAINQQINLSHGLSYMVTKVERNFTSNSRYLVADSGKELVKITVVAGNRVKSGTTFVAQTLFTLKTSAGADINAEFVINSDLPDKLQSTAIESGKQISGALIYEVASGEKLASFNTTDTYKNLSTSEQVTIKSSIKL